MKAQVTHITLKLVRSLKRGEIQRYADTEVPGFQVWVGKRAISYFLRKRSHNKEYTILLGHFPEMLPEEARTHAISKLADVAHRLSILPSGKNPTLKEAIDFYLTLDKRPGTMTNVRSISRSLEALFSRGIYDMTREDMMMLHNKHKNTPVKANAILKTTQRIINAYIKHKGLSPHNITSGITLFKERARERYLNDVELHKFFDGIEQLKNTPGYRYAMYADVLLVLLYTGARKGNVMEMCIEEITENNIWVIPESKYKGKREHKVALGADELAIIRKYIGDRKKGYVFPHNTPGSAQTILLKVKKQLCQLVGLNDFRIHDLRRTLGTWMLNEGVAIGVVAKKLGHSSIHTTESVYTHLIPEVSIEVTDKVIRKMRKKDD